MTELQRKTETLVCWLINQNKTRWRLISEIPYDALIARVNGIDIDISCFDQERIRLVVGKERIQLNRDQESRLRDDFINTVCRFTGRTKDDRVCGYISAILGA